METVCCHEVRGLSKVVSMRRTTVIRHWAIDNVQLLYCSHNMGVRVVN